MSIPELGDRITLSGLRVFAHHGVFESEREDGQEFVIDVTVWLDLSPAASGDDLAETIHYGELAVQVTEAVKNEPVDLIETVAERVAQVVLAGSLGVTYVAPYLGRLDDLDAGEAGHAIVARMHQALSASDTRLLVASVRTPADIETLVGNGITDITARPEVIEACLEHPESIAAAATFLAAAGFDS